MIQHYATQGIFVALVFGTGFVIDEHATVSLGIMMSLGVFLVWVGRKWQSILDGQKSLSEQLSALSEQMKNLPCSMFRTGDCSEERTKTKHDQ